MSLNRREMLRLGAAGAGGLLLSSAGLAETPLSYTFKLPDPLAPVAPTVPAAPVVTPAAPGGIDPVLFDKAKAALQSHRFFVPKRDVIGIVDFAKASNTGRFHIVNLASGQVESHMVAHGRGSDPDHSGFLERFSNGFGSLASSNGTYITSDTYNGKYGLSMKVKGLDWSNNNAEARAIVIHNAWYAEPEVAAAHGKLGRSEGCFAFSRASQWSVMDRLGGGRMIYADKLA
jgi:hypothetical protein